MTSAAVSGDRLSMGREYAETVAAIFEELHGGGTGRIAAPAGPHTREPARGCPVCGCQPPRMHPVLADGPATRLVAWLVGYYHRPGLRIGEAAAAVGVSVRHLELICRRDFGCTPVQILAAIRLYRARLMLTGNGPAPHSVAEVARAAGFTRVSRFASAYRRRYGTAPVITVRITADPSSGPQPAAAGEV